VTCIFQGEFSLNIEEVIRAVREDDLLQGGVEMICRGLVLTPLGADILGRRVEEVSRMEHEMSEASGNLRQAMDANTTYEKKLCDQAFDFTYTRPF